MKFYISYFYQVRNFSENMIPFSTALWDPKWFHEFKDQQHTFKDKNNVVNGLRAEMLHPDPTNTYCIQCEEKNPQFCDFMINYKDQLRSLNFEKTIAELESRAKQIIENPIVILLVHEAPDNKCSERWPLIEWFRDNGIELEEFKKGE